LTHLEQGVIIQGRNNKPGYGGGTVERRTTAPLARARRVIAGVETDVIEIGSGRPLLFLHSGEGPAVPSDRYLRTLAETHRVIAPWHPGFGYTDIPADFRNVGDLAYFYLDLAHQYDLNDAVLCGASFGGWIAAEVCVRSTQRFSSLVLVDALGIKVSGRETRDIADIFAMPAAELVRTSYVVPAIAARDTTRMDEADLTAIVRSREALCYYGWQPYMHNPQLKRWLHRIRIPTLVLWGAQDRIASAECGRVYAAAIPDARLAVIDDAGHYPHIEKPDDFAGHVAAFSTANGNPMRTR
jgi:pimeloyl-ACP methyl ester carboxylesterase